MNLTIELIFIYSGDDGLSALANQNPGNDPFISDEPISLKLLTKQLENR